MKPVLKNLVRDQVDVISAATKDETGKAELDNPPA